MISATASRTEARSRAKGAAEPHDGFGSVSRSCARPPCKRRLQRQLLFAAQDVELHLFTGLALIEQLREAARDADLSAVDARDDVAAAESRLVGRAVGIDEVDRESFFALGAAHAEDRPAEPAAPDFAARQAFPILREPVDRHVDVRLERFGDPAVNADQLAA